MKKILLLLILCSGCCNSKYQCEIDSAFSDVMPMVNEANAAFDKAEKELLSIKPDDIIRPNPDPAKCPCKGTGKIRQGDDHVTECPYHGNVTRNLTR